MRGRPILRRVEILVAILIASIILLPTSLPPPASAGWIVCAGAKGWCVMKPPWHAPSDHNETTLQSLPNPPGTCATTSEDGPPAAYLSSGNVSGDVYTEVNSAPCFAGAYLALGFSTDTWDALGSDQLFAYWNYSAAMEIWLDCGQTSPAAYIYSVVRVGLNLYDLNAGQWVYTVNNQPMTGNNTPTWNDNHLYEDCHAGSGDYIQLGGWCGGQGVCHAAIQFTNLNTVHGHTYFAYIWMEAIDPTGGLQTGDVAYGCVMLDSYTSIVTLGERPCTGNNSLGAQLTSVHID